MGFELKKFYSKIYRTYDLVNRLFTFGMDKRWRNFTARQCLNKNPKEILDLCCGTGDLTISLSKNNTSDKTRITGYDFNPDMLKIAAVKANKKGLQNVRFTEGNAANLPFKDKHFDGITIGFGFRNLIFENPSGEKHIEEMYRVLKKGGKLFILESGVPKNPVIRFFYKAYLYLFLFPLGTIISGNAKAYWYLVHSSSKFYSVEKTTSVLKNKQFSHIESKTFFLGAANLITATK